MPSVSNSIIRNMVGTPNGALVNLPKPARQIRITCGTGGACLVRAQPVPANGPFTAPTAPSATPQPTSGNVSGAGWEVLVAGAVWTSPLLLNGDSFQPVEIWETAPGNLTCEGIA